ncbi:hypothetical protein MKW92_037033 [Papaver armeniacum]|nr:hypothetical protein MKW92_037033 [Papaver armeniacum]
MQHLAFAGSGKQSSGKSLEEHGQRPIKLYLYTTSSRLPYVCSNWVYRFQTSTDFSGGSEFKALSNKHGHSYHHLNCRRNLHIRECIQAHA